MVKFFSSAALALGIAFAAFTLPSVAAPEPQCGGVDENTRECSREGRQSPAGGAVEDDRGTGRLLATGECPRGSRECFPETAPRGDLG
jgi:hypothetical protein